MAEDLVQVAQESYDRCCAADRFFDDFYDLLLASHPAIPPMFAGTEFPRQHRLLRHAIGLLLSYGRRANPHLLERIAERHSRRDVDVPPDLHRHFVDSLVAAVARHDPAFSPAVEQAWRAAVAPGITFIGARY